jgi:hypothetical protein
MAEPPPDRGKERLSTFRKAVLGTVGVIITAVLVSWAVGLFGFQSSGGSSTVIREGTGAEATTTTAGIGNGSPDPSFEPDASARVVVEYADNRGGSPVFADPMGKAVENTDEETIPYEEEVPVSCFTKNKSGIESVNYFYLVASGRWQGDYVPANTMTNGGAIGDEGSPALDPRVKPCEAGE